MQYRVALVGTVLGVGLTTACTRTNPAYDPDGEPVDGSEETTTTFEDEGLTDDPPEPTTDGSGNEPGVDGGGDSGESEGSTGTPDGDDEPVVEEPPPEDDRLLYSTLDSPQAVLAPATGVGPGELGGIEPELVDGPTGGAMRFAMPGQWIAFPQRRAGTPNIDHREGLLEVDVRFELSAPHFEPCDLFSLSGVISDGGGLRVGVADLFDGNRLWVEYIDASGFVHLTRFPAGLLPQGEWVHLTLEWNANVEEDEPNVALWIDGEPIDPLPGSTTGPKVVGDPSDEDVLLLGSWSLSDGFPARASFDELQIFPGD